MQVDSGGHVIQIMLRHLFARNAARGAAASPGRFEKMNTQTPVVDQ